jgi:hypothetical protein
VRVVYPGGVARDQKLLEQNKGEIITIKGKRKQDLYEEKRYFNNNSLFLSDLCKLHLDIL